MSGSDAVNPNHVEIDGVMYEAGHNSDLDMLGVIGCKPPDVLGR